MAKPVPTLVDLAAPNHFPATFRAWVLEKAEWQREQFGKRINRFQRAHLAVVHSFAEYLAGECDDVFDQRMVVLALVSREVASIEREEGKDVPRPMGGVVFRPTKGQIAIIGTLGDELHAPPPPPDHTLSEMAAAAVRDLIVMLHGQRADLGKKAKDLDRELAKAQARIDQGRADQEEMERLRSENAELREEKAEQAATIEELTIYLGDRKPPRRKKLQEGIYRTDSGKFQARVPDEKKGGTKWSDPVDTLDEARELRAAAGGAEPTEADLEAALDAREAEVGRELTDEEIDAVRDELANSMSAADEAATEEVTA